MIVWIFVFSSSHWTGQYVLMFIVNVALKFFASGSYAVIYIYANELFPTQARNTGIGICSMVARVGAIIGTLSNDLLVRTSIASSLSLQRWFRLDYGHIFLSLSLASPLSLQLHPWAFVQKQPINHYLKPSTTSKSWDLLCTFFSCIGKKSLSNHNL